MDAAVRAVSDGTPERIVAAEAEYAMRHAGADGWAAPTFVASGWRSAMAHGPASSKPIASGDVVQIYVAPIVEGYTVDLCRTWPTRRAGSTVRVEIVRSDTKGGAVWPGVSVQTFTLKPDKYEASANRLAKRRRSCTLAP